MKRLSAHAHPRLIRAALLAALGIALAACGAAPSAAPAAAAQPALPAPIPTPAALAALAARARPCDLAAKGVVSASAAQPQSAEPITATAALIHYDDSSNTIELRRGASATLPAVSGVIGRSDVLRELAPGEWLLAAKLRVEAGAALRLEASAVRWLKLRSDDRGFVWLRADGGKLDLSGVCVTSWDTQRGGFDERYADGRSYILARDGAQMTIRGADIRYLGYDGPGAYGLAWRQTAEGGVIEDSFVSHNYYGVYSYQASGMVIRNNETDHNVMYGIDPHTRSSRLLIENNVAHDNGKHGIILAEECGQSILRGNVAYNNLHHGIVIYQQSDNNLVEGNTVYGNGGQGININDAAGTTVRGNTAYDNLEAGIGVGQGASATEVIGNRVQANRKDGISLYSEGKSTVLRDNTVVGNARYGVYVKSEGDLRAEGNQIAGNAVGVYLNIARQIEVSQQSNRIQGNREADVRRGGDAGSAAVAEDQP